MSISTIGEANNDLSNDTESELSQEINYFVDEVAGGKISKEKKTQLLRSLTELIQESSNKIIDTISTNNRGIGSEVLYDGSTNFNEQLPCINIIIGNPQMDMSYALNYPYYGAQQQPMQMLPNQYSINYPNYQMPQYQYLQPFQQPNLLGYNQLPIQFPEFPAKPTKTKSKDHKKSNKKKEGKKSSKSEKDKKKKIKKEKKDEIIQFKHEDGNEFNGIIKYLTDKTNGNIHDNGTIEVSSNSILPGYPPRNLLNRIKKDQYQSKGSSFAWICFDFKDMKIELSNYTIESCSWHENIGHIKSWVIEISDDKEHWSIIDRKDDCSDLNGKDLVKTFDVQPNKFSRYIRFRHTAETWDGGTYGFNSIEFYGRLKIPNKEK